MGMMGLGAQVGRAVGPLFITSVYVEYGMRITGAVCAGITVIYLLTAIILYRRLEPYAKTGEVYISKHNGVQLTAYRGVSETRDITKHNGVQLTSYRGGNETHETKGHIQGYDGPFDENGLKSE